MGESAPSVCADQPRSAEIILYFLLEAGGRKMFTSLLLLSITVTGLAATNLWCGHSQEWNKSFSTVDLINHNNPHHFSQYRAASGERVQYSLTAGVGGMLPP